MKLSEIPKDKIVNLKDKTALIYDYGLFTELARTLSKKFKKVYYFVPWQSAFPKSNQRVVGTGIDGVERIQDFFDYVDKADIIVFPDVHNGDLQVFLEKMGKNVWGSRKGEEMELFRDSMKEHMKKLGLYTTPYKVVKGMDALRDYLKKHDKVYVKQNITRGDKETFRSSSYKVIETVLDEMEHNLGALKYTKEFVVEDALDDAVEIGCDMYTVNGKYPQETLVGIEVKGMGLCGRIIPYDKISTKLTDFNTKIAPTLKNYGYRGFLSTEVRISKDKPPYMVDLCCRCPSPPNELYQLMYKNLPEIIWYGAQGYIIDPEYKHEYGIQANIHASWVEKNWEPIFFPEKYRENIKLKNLCIINGKHYCVPQDAGSSGIGAIVAEGDTLDECVEQIKKIANTIEAHGIEVEMDSIDTALEEFDKLEKLGVKIL
jgi:phosphoribosylamine-glycine ligase